MELEVKNRLARVKDFFKLDYQILSSEKLTTLIDEKIQEFREAHDFGFTSSADANGENDGFRRIGSAKLSRNLPFTRMQKIFDAVVHVAHSNLIAKWILGTTADFVVAGVGLSYTAENKQVQEVLNNFIKINKLDIIEQRSMVHELGLFGEAAYPVFTKKTTGEVKIGIIDPQRITTVRSNPENIKEMTSLSFINSSDLASTKKLEIIKDRNGTLQGEVFFYKINTVSSMTRGLSDLYTLVDYIDGFDKVLFDSIERVSFGNAFLLDVMLKGMNEAQIGKWISENNTRPAPGTSVVHNENVEYEFKTAKMQDSDPSSFLKDLLAIIVGTAGYSLPWLGIGDNTNRATAKEMSVATKKMLQTRQGVLQNIFRDFGEYALQQAQLSGNGTLSPSLPSQDLKFTVNIPEIIEGDIEGVSSSLKDMVSSMTLAKGSSLVSQDTAIASLIPILEKLNVNIDVADEKDKIDKDNAEINIVDEMVKNAPA